MRFGFVDEGNNLSNTLKAIQLQGLHTYRSSNSGSSIQEGSSKASSWKMSRLMCFSHLKVLQGSYAQSEADPGCTQGFYKSHLVLVPGGKGVK